MKVKDKKNQIDLIIKIILVIIIIVLLIHNCNLVKDKYNNNKPSKDNVDVIDINCDDNECKTSTPTPLLPKEIDSVSFKEKNINIKKGDSLKLNVIIKPTNLYNEKLNWKSSNTNVVTVDSDGNIKAISEGEATITVTSSNGKTASCIVKVMKDIVEIKEIKLEIKNKNIKIGEEEQIIATIKPSNATNRELIWSSSDTSIATVNENGIIKGIKSGKVTITVKNKSGKVIATSEITVQNNLTPTKEIEDISFVEKNISIKEKDSLKAIVQIKPIDLSNAKLNWKSSNTNIATVDSDGNIKAISEGEATITVTSSNGKTASCIVKVSKEEIEIEEIKLIIEEKNINIGEEEQIIASIKPSNATNRELIWSSSDSSIATVNESGIIKGIKSGKVTITVKNKSGKVIATSEITVQDMTGELEVYDNDHTSISWNGANDLKIFTKSLYNIDGVIAPESENTYEFVIKNSTKYNLKYNIEFIETNQYNINMKYKLRKNDTYLIDNYVSYNELNINNQLLNSNNKDVYYLEWKWISSNNDTNIGKNPEAKYGLKIQVEAEGING